MTGTCLAPSWCSRDRGTSVVILHENSSSRARSQPVLLPWPAARNKFEGGRKEKGQKTILRRHCDTTDARNSTSSPNASTKWQTPRSKRTRAAPGRKCTLPRAHIRPVRNPLHNRACRLNCSPSKYKNAKNLSRGIHSNLTFSGRGGDHSPIPR